MSGLKKYFWDYNFEEEEPPKDIRMFYETQLSEVYNNNWKQKYDEIRTKTYNNLLNDLTKKDRNFVARNNYKSNLQFDELIKLDNDNFMNKNEFENLVRITQKCNEDIFYVGKIYSVLTCKEKRTTRTTVYENHIINSFIKKLRVEFGIYLEKDFPKFLKCNEKVMNQIFTRFQVNENTLSILSPFNLEMFSKFVEYVNGLRVKKQVEEYFNVTQDDIM